MAKIPGQDTRGIALGAFKLQTEQLDRGSKKQGGKIDRPSLSISVLKWADHKGANRNDNEKVDELVEIEGIYSQMKVLAAPTPEKKKGSYHEFFDV